MTKSQALNTNAVYVAFNLCCSFIWSCDILSCLKTENLPSRKKIKPLIWYINYIFVQKKNAVYRKNTRKIICVPHSLYSRWTLKQRTYRQSPGQYMLLHCHYFGLLLHLGREKHHSLARPASSHQHISIGNHTNLCQLRCRFFPLLTSSELNKGVIINLKCPKPALPYSESAKVLRFIMAVSQ